MQLTIAELERQLDEARKDAERYRWLRDQHWVHPEAEFRLNLGECDDLRTYHNGLNAAIDAAMKGTP